MAGFSVNSSFRLSFETGLVTVIAAATATAGQLFSMRFVSSDLLLRLRALEVEFIVTTAFGAAQEVGFDVIAARKYTASPTAGTAVALAGDDGKLRSGQLGTRFVADGDIRTASASAITAGTNTLDSQPFARGSFWTTAIGDSMQTRRYDFTGLPTGGLLFASSEGFIVRNTILMGATGVGKWKITPEWDEGVLTF